MTEIEKKALALAIEAREDDKMRLCPDPTLYFCNWESLCRAIEQHEAFKREVSDAVEAVLSTLDQLVLDDRGEAAMRGIRLVAARFILPKPVKNDPLVEAMLECGFGDSSNAADDIRAALAARGLEIREINP